MANQQELINWVLANADALDLQVTNVTWIDPFFKGWTDLDVSIKIEGQIFSGRGAAATEDIALSKAVCEAIERHVCTSHGVTSLGVAGHFDKECAMVNAELEFIERAALSYHVSNQIPAVNLTSEQMTFPVNGLPDVDLKVHTLKMLSPENITAIICLAEGVSSGTNFGGILGLGCDFNEHVARTKARIECFRNATSLRKSIISPISKREFDAIELPTSLARQQLLFNASFCKSLLKMLVVDETHSQEGTFFSNLRLIHNSLGIQTRGLEDCPLQFYRCIDENGYKLTHIDFVG